MRILLILGFASLGFSAHAARNVLDCGSAGRYIPAQDKPYWTGLIPIGSDGEVGSSVVWKSKRFLTSNCNQTRLEEKAPTALALSDRDTPEVFDCGANGRFGTVTSEAYWKTLHPISDDGEVILTQVRLSKRFLTLNCKPVALDLRKSAPSAVAPTATIQTGAAS